MIKVVFVGDEPGRLNINKDIAFVGTRSMETLAKWIKTIQPDYYVCYNSHTSENLDKIDSLYKNNFNVVALGNKASNRLKKLNITHYKLPHPSGLNRNLNDHQKLSLDLALCRLYIGH